MRNDRVDFIDCAGWFRFRGAFSTVVWEFFVICVWVEVGLVIAAWFRLSGFVFDECLVLSLFLNGVCLFDGVWGFLIRFDLFVVNALGLLWMG